MGIWNLTDISSSYHFHIFNLLIELRPSRPSSSCGAENKGLVSLHHETSTKPFSKRKVCILEISNFAGHWWCTAFRIPCGTGMLVVHSVSYREILISHLHVLLGRKCIYPGTFILKASRCCMCTEHYWAASTIIAKTSCVVVRQPACMPGRDPLIAFNFVQRIQVPQHHLSKE